MIFIYVLLGIILIIALFIILPLHIFERVLIALILGTLVLSMIANYKADKIDLEPLHEEVVTETKKEILFEDSVYNYIKELKIKHPNIVMRQARIESGNFKSNVFKDNNNMFGFKQAYKRPNTQIGVNRGYAVYESWKECVIDYALYQTYSAKNLNRNDYLEFLGRNYAEDPNYINLIK